MRAKRIEDEGTMTEMGRVGRTVALQLRDSIMERLRESGLEAGARIPTEAQLCGTFNASRPTVREALKLLEQDGVIRVVHGRGRFLTAAGTIHVDRPITTFESITDMTRHHGYVLENKVLGITEDEPDEAIRNALQLQEGDKVIRLERLRLLGRDPVIYCLDYVRRDVVTDRLFEIDWSGSLLDLLETYNARPQLSTAVIRAESLPKDVTTRYGLEDFGMSLTIEETTYTDAGIPVNHAVDYHRGSHFSFSFLRK